MIRFDDLQLFVRTAALGSFSQAAREADLLPGQVAAAVARLERELDLRLFVRTTRSLLNPKAILFYMAFLPLFIDPKAHQGIATFAALAGIILVVSIAYCSMLIGVGNLARRRLIQQISDALRRVAGLFLVGFGIRLGLNG